MHFVCWLVQVGVAIVAASRKSEMRGDSESRRARSKKKLEEV